MSAYSEWAHGLISDQEYNSIMNAEARREKAMEEATWAAYLDELDEDDVEGE